MPDFFLDEFPEELLPSPEKAAPAPPVANSEAVTDPVGQLFASITSMLGEDVVKKTNALYAFEVKGSGNWFLDLKAGAGSAGQGAPPGKPDATLIMDSQDFVKMFTGQ